MLDYLNSKFLTTIFSSQMTFIWKEEIWSSTCNFGRGNDWGSLVVLPNETTLPSRG